MSPSIENHSPYLRENGPIIEFVIKPSSASIDLKKMEKKDIPWIKVRALIDTGASTTAISQKVIDKLDLVQTGTAKVFTSANTAEIRNEYDVCVEFDTNAYTDTLRVLGANLQDHSIDCLIGRDILNYCTLTYIGPKDKYILSFGEE